MRTVWIRFLVRSIGLIFLIVTAAGDGRAGEVDTAYRQAVADAAIAEAGEISSELIPIVRDNRQLRWHDDGSRVLVCTWKSQDAYERFLRSHTRTSVNPGHVVWVTTVPQVRTLCSRMVAANPGISGEAVDLRLKQYLGLDPHWRYDVFIEMWVDPADLFRPCVDPQTDDRRCDLHFGDTLPQVKNIDDYRSFYEHLYYTSFRGSTGVPWTGLGYTYDWGNAACEVGASEFILVPGAAYEIKQVLTTMEYCVLGSGLTH